MHVLFQAVFAWLSHFPHVGCSSAMEWGGGWLVYTLVPSRRAALTQGRAVKGLKAAGGQGVCRQQTELQHLLLQLAHGLRRAHVSRHGLHIRTGPRTTHRLVLKEQGLVR